MPVRRGKVKKYLGMTLDCTVSGIYITSMLEYIDEILATFYTMDPINIGIKSSAAPENLFKVDEDCEKLSLDKAKGLHNLVVITIYTTNRDKPDKFKPVALLTTRVRETDTYNWRNLDHLMKYLRKKEIYHSSWDPVAQES